MSSISTAALLSKNAVNYATALSCASFSKGPKLNLTAQNMAASIYMLCKARNPKFSATSKYNAGYMTDILTVYQYAVSLNPKNVETLVSLGNAFMDMDRQEDAKILYQAALKLQKDYKPAHEGMAAYYLARGDMQRAKKELENNMMMFLSGKGSDDRKKQTDLKSAPDTKEGDSAEVSEAKIAKLSKLPLVSMADFIDEIDPADAQQIRLKVNNLPQNDKLTLPKLTSIAQISQYKVYVNDTECFSDMQLATNDFFDKWESELDELEQKAFNEAAGLGIESVNSIYEVRDNQDNHLMEYMFWYNTTVLNKKTSAYFNYFSKTVSTKSSLISTRKEAASKVIKGLYDQEADKIEQIQNSDASDEVKAAQIVKIQAEYALQRNEKRQSCFQDNYSMAIQLYFKIKPMIEKYWADCMPNVRLLPEGPIRDTGYFSIARTSFGMAQQVIQMVFDSADVDGYYEDVTGQDFTDAGENLREIYRQKAEQEYEDANTPSSFSDQALLDKFSKSFSSGPIELKVTPYSLEITFAMLAAGKMGINWKDNTFSGGIGLGVKGEIGVAMLGAKGEAVTMLTYTYDMKTGKVTDLDWKANAGASVSVDAGVKTEAGMNYESSVMHGTKFSSGITTSYGDLSFEAISN
jgi:tetratricopeptide (TPR) repeat protein